MAKFCGKCGSPLNENGQCPRCGASQNRAPSGSGQSGAGRPVGSGQPGAGRPVGGGQSGAGRPVGSGQPGAGRPVGSGPNGVRRPPAGNGQPAGRAPAGSGQPGARGSAQGSGAPGKPVKMTREQKKAAKKAEKKRRKKEKRAAMTFGQKAKIFFLKLLAILLALAILAGSVSCALVYFDLADIPFVEKIMGWFGYEKDKEESSENNGEDTTSDVAADADMSTPYHVDPPDADAYYASNAQIISKVKASESPDIHTEAEAYQNLTSRGFTQYPISAYYNTSGDFVQTDAISDSATAQHPMYQTYYTSTAGEIWSVLEINGVVIAQPLSYMEQSDGDVPLIFSEKETSTSYDGTTNTFYVTIPKESTANLIKVDTINAETLDGFTSGVIAGL